MKQNGLDWDRNRSVAQPCDSRAPSHNYPPVTLIVYGVKSGFSSYCSWSRESKFANIRGSYLWSCPDGRRSPLSAR